MGNALNVVLCIYLRGYELFSCSYPSLSSSSRQRYNLPCFHFKLLLKPTCLAVQDLRLSLLFRGFVFPVARPAFVFSFPDHIAVAFGDSRKPFHIPCPQFQREALLASKNRLPSHFHVWHIITRASPSFMLMGVETLAVFSLNTATSKKYIGPPASCSVLREDKSAGGNLLDLKPLLPIPC